MNEDKMLTIQQQVRQNHAELGDYLKDLESWTEDIKLKDDSLKESADGKQTYLPPVRNSLDIKRKKKKKKPQNESNQTKKASRIRSYDYKSWDKFDVDKACEEVDGHNSSASEYETDEEWEIERKKQQAVLFKEEGNQFLKETKLAEAVEAYTKGIDCDPSNAILPANRALALLKQEKYAAAELDCTQSLYLNDKYIKAYQRRGTARAALKKYAEAKEDFLAVLKHEPHNKQAKAELDNIEKLLNPPKIIQSANLESDGRGIVKPVYKPPGQRSKKPLVQVQIEEIGIEETIIRAPKASEMKKKVQAEDEAKFEQTFLHNKPEDNLNCDISDASTNNLKNKITDKIKEIIDVSSQKEGALQSNGFNEAEIADTEDTPKSTIKCISEDNKQPICQQQLSPRVPPLPSNSFQFQADFKVLKNTTDIFYQYIKQIEPNQYPKLFGEALESDMLMKILTTLQEFYIRKDEPVFDVLLHLSKVKRFDMTVMFMSPSEKKVVHGLFDYARSNHDGNPDDLNKLQKKYAL